MQGLRITWIPVNDVVSPSGMRGAAQLGRWVLDLVVACALFGGVARADVLPTGGVIEKVRTTYSAGLMRCYKQYLAKNASARGIVKLAFTVTSTGAVSDATATGLAGEIDRCVVGLMSGWRFSIPKDSSNKPAAVDYAITTAFAPD
jgi:hypothetical protein